jgi:putative PIN family toxin of toxin-antitoxin system
MRVLLDTNIWISGLLWGGIVSKILLLAEQKRITIIVSPPLLTEIQNTLNYPKLQKQLQKINETPDNLLAIVQQLSEICLISVKLDIKDLRDSQDLFILETAISADVKVIVTGDQDLLIIKQIAEIPIMTARNFLDHYFPND